MAKTAEEILVGKLQKKYGPEVAMLLSSGTGRSAVTDVCPSGLGVLDHHVLGMGGMPYGRIMEMFGGEGSGKTSLMDRFIAGCQRDNGIAVLIETEQKYDPDWARLHGVDPARLVLLQPDNLEQCLTLMERVILDKPTSRHLLVCLDSVACSAPKKATDDGLSGDAAVAEEARIWSRAFKLLPKLASNNKAGIILVNQIRMKIGVMYGNPEVTPGGNAIKFGAAIRLQVNYGQHVKDGAATVGKFLNLNCHKNQMSPPFRKAKLKLNFTEGFDDRWSTLEHAKEMGCVETKCRKVDEALAALGWPAAVAAETASEADLEADPVLEAAQEEEA